MEIMPMPTRQIPLTRARIELGRLARKEGLAPGEVVEVTRRGAVALVLQRAEDYVRLRQQKTRRPPRLWGSLTIIGDLEAASGQVNARLQERFRNRRAR
jgi:hypothetical protein